MESTRSAEREAKRRYWEEHLSRWESSGLRQSEYCRLNGLGLHRFIYWKNKRCRPTPPVTLVEWAIPRQEEVASPSDVPSLCVLIGTRYRIEIRPEFDPAIFDTVVRILRAL